MATIKKTFKVTEKQDEWIRTRVESGEYSSESDYIRELLRRDKEAQNYYQDTKAAIEYGLQSGTSDKTLEDIWTVAESNFRDEYGD